MVRSIVTPNKPLWFLATKNEARYERYQRLPTILDSFCLCMYASPVVSSFPKKEDEDDDDDTDDDAIEEGEPWFILITFVAP